MLLLCVCACVRASRACACACLCAGSVKIDTDTIKGLANKKVHDVSWHDKWVGAVLGENGLIYGAQPHS